MSDPTKHLPLAPRDLMILAVLAEAPLHGYGLIKAVEERSDAGVLLDPANLYRVLRRMREAGWIKELPAEAETRRTYSISSRGRHLLRAEVTRLEGLLRSVQPTLAGGSNG